MSIDQNDSSIDPGATSDDYGALWQPWVPDIGERVIVRGQPECFYCRETWEMEDGQIGTVVSINHDMSTRLYGCDPSEYDPLAKSHHVLIEWDKDTRADVMANGKWSHFAPSELEPLSVYMAETMES